MKQFFNKRWKLLLVVLVVIMVCLGMYIKKYNIERKKYITFASPDNSFTVDHPRNWEVQPLTNKGALVATFITDERKELSSNRPYINIAKGAVQGKLPEVYAATLEKYKKLFRDMTVVSETAGKVNGADAMKLIFDGVLGGKKTRYIVIIMEEKGVLYTITASSSQLDSVDLEEQVTKMLDSRQFTS